MVDFGIYVKFPREILIDSHSPLPLWSPSPVLHVVAAVPSTRLSCSVPHVHAAASPCHSTQVLFASCGVTIKWVLPGILSVAAASCPLW
jgi:hypothetical protein